ncbi:MAG: TonB-dependent receptor [Gammaproteobacteria bacterium]|nr:TonB-dependent receptor [Gammaproteobacteria bacterium]
MITLFSGLCAVPAQAQIEELVVTAQRRQQTLRDVPVAVTALSAEMLDQRGIHDFASYLTTIPGAAVVDSTGFGGEVKFRGVGTGINAQMSPTTAIYLGEVPVIHTGRNVNSSYNFWLVDLERVEVLRGPQGQLFGSNSLGGAVRNIPAKPVLDAFQAKVNVTGSYTGDGAGGWNGDVVLNVPLITNVLGARLALYTSDDSGWYDNAFRGGPSMASLAAPGVAPPYIAVAGFFPGPIAAPPGSTLPAANVVLIPPAPPPAPPGPPVIVPGGPPGVLGIHPNPAAAAAFSAPPLSRTEDTNATDINGGRLMLSWQPNERFSADVMIAIEDRETFGSSFAEYVPAFSPDPLGGPPTPNFGASTDFRDYEHFEAARAGTKDDMHLYNLVLEYDFDFATLTSSTSYWERTEFLASDLSMASIRITGVFDTVPLVSNRWDNPEVWVQELRLTSNDTDSRVDWLAGFFYQEIDQRHRVLGVDQSGLDLRYWTDVVLSGIPGPFAPLPPTTTTLADNRGEFTDEQIAFFGQIGFDLTETIHAAVSFRWLTLDQEFSSVSKGFQFGFAQGSQSGANDDEIFTPRFELSWKPGDDQLYYASASKGFRTGIVNIDVPLASCGVELANAGFPGGLPDVDPDTLWNYELGAKLGMFDRRLQVNGALFYIDWSKVQQTFVLSAFNPFGSGVSQCTFPAVANFGDASSMGMELEVSALLTERLRLDASFSYVDAEFEDTIMTPTGPLVSKGDTIPLTPDVTSFVALQYDFNVAALPAWGRFEWHYVSEKEPLPLDLDPDNYVAPIPFEIGNYHQLNLRAGIDITGSVRAEAFITNLLDEFGVTASGDTGGFGFPFLSTIRPRTGGATLRWQF